MDCSVEGWHSMKVLIFAYLLGDKYFIDIFTSPISHGMEGVIELVVVDVRLCFLQDREFFVEFTSVLGEDEIPIVSIFIGEVMEVEARVGEFVYVYIHPILWLTIIGMLDDVLHTVEGYAQYLNRCIALKFFHNQ